MRGPPWSSHLSSYATAGLPQARSSDLGSLLYMLIITQTTSSKLKILNTIYAPKAIFPIMKIYVSVHVWVSVCGFTCVSECQRSSTGLSLGDVHRVFKII